MVAFYAYFGHIPTKEDIQSLLPVSDSAEPTSSASIHETLVAITVSGDTVTYNGEVLSSVDELNNRLSKETDPTISLINNDANASTYNKVVEIVNNYGGNLKQWMRTTQTHQLTQKKTLLKKILQKV